MPGPRPKNNSDWRDGFLFLGNHLALDFLNTRPVRNGEAEELLPEFNALLRWFVAAGLLGSNQADRLQRDWGDSAKAGTTVEALRRLREKWRKAIPGWQGATGVHKATAQELNRLMAAHPILHRLQTSNHGNSIDVSFAPSQPEDFFAPLAYNAAKLFAEVDSRRVRKCSHCVLYFHDTSKKGTRRWCSMSLCGNRYKVAAYATRQRAKKKRTGLQREERP